MASGFKGTIFGASDIEGDANNPIRHLSGKVGCVPKCDQLAASTARPSPTSATVPDAKQYVGPRRTTFDYTRACQFLCAFERHLFLQRVQHGPKRTREQAFRCFQGLKNTICATSLLVTARRAPVLIPEAAFESTKLWLARAFRRAPRVALLQPHGRLGVGFGGLGLPTLQNEVFRRLRRKQERFRLQGKELWTYSIPESDEQILQPVSICTHMYIHMLARLFVNT